MPALIPTEHYATVTWLGVVPHRDRLEIDGLAVEELPLDFEGQAGSAYHGVNRPSCSRVKSQYPVGTEIRNVRQLTIVSAEELGQIAAKIGLEALDPAWLGASIVVEGIADFTHVPPSSRLQGPGGVTLTVDMQNQPCTQVSKTIAQHHPAEGKGFKPAAKGRRGVTAWVERPGTLRLGERLRLHVPEQRAWAP